MAAAGAFFRKDASYGIGSFGTRLFVARPATSRVQQHEFLTDIAPAALASTQNDPHLKASMQHQFQVLQSHEVDSKEQLAAQMREIASSDDFVEVPCQHDVSHGEQCDQLLSISHEGLLLSFESACGASDEAAWEGVVDRMLSCFPCLLETSIVTGLDAAFQENNLLIARRIVFRSSEHMLRWAPDALRLAATHDCKDPELFRDLLQPYQPLSPTRPCMRLSPKWLDVWYPALLVALSRGDAGVDTVDCLMSASADRQELKRCLPLPPQIVNTVDEVEHQRHSVKLIKDSSDTLACFEQSRSAVASAVFRLSDSALQEGNPNFAKFVIVVCKSLHIDMHMIDMEGTVRSAILLGRPCAGVAEEFAHGEMQPADGSGLLAIQMVEWVKLATAMCHPCDGELPEPAELAQLISACLRCQVAAGHSAGSLRAVQKILMEKITHVDHGASMMPTANLHRDLDYIAASIKVPRNAALLRHALAHGGRALPWLHGETAPAGLLSSLEGAHAEPVLPPDLKNEMTSLARHLLVSHGGVSPPIRTACRRFFPGEDVPMTSYTNDVQLFLMARDHDQRRDDHARYGNPRPVTRGGEIAVVAVDPMAEL